MAGANDIIIQGLIELHLKGEGGVQAEASMKKILESAKAVVKETGGLGEGFKKTGQQVGFLESQFKSLGTTVAAYFGARAVANFLADSYLGFARVERQALATENQIRALGQAAEGAGFRTFIKNLSETSGILDDDLVPAFQRAFGALKDYKAATEIVTIASKFAANGIGDVGSNVDALASFFQGGRALGLKAFGIDLKAAADGTIDLTQGLDAVKAAADTLGSGFDDAQSRVLTFKQVIDSAKDSIGELLDGFVQIAASPRKVLTEFFEDTRAQLDPKFAVELYARRADEAKQAFVDAFFNANTEVDASSQLFAERQAGRDKTAADEKAAKALEAEKDRLEKVAALEGKTAIDLLQQQVAATTVRSQARIDAELALNKRVEEDTIRTYKAVGAATVELEKFFAGERARIRNQPVDEESGLLGPGNAEGIAEFRKANEKREEEEARHQEELTQILEDGLIARLEVTAALAPEGSQEKRDAEDALAAARLEVDTQRKIRKAEGDAAKIKAINEALEAALAGMRAIRRKNDDEDAKIKLQNNLLTTQAIIGSFAPLFAKNKAFSLAMAVVNTALGISAVWAHSTNFYESLAQTLIVAASGLAQIRAIQSANIGSGGGISTGATATAPTQAAPNPNPSSASVAPQSESDFAALAGRAPGGPKGGVTVNIGTAFGDDYAMVKLAHRIARTLRNDPAVLR